MAIAAIAIDPSYIAFDEGSLRSSEDLERRILLLRVARRLIASSTAIAILMPEDTDIDLVQSNYYPYHGRIEQLLRSLGLQSVYSANDVRVIVQEVIARSETLEEYVGVRFALYDNDVKTSPDCAECYFDRRLFDLFVQALGLISAGIVADSTMRNTIRLSCPLSSWCSRVEFSGTLQASEPDCGYQGLVSEKFVLANEYRSFVESLDGLTLWRSASDSEGFAFSLFVGAVKMLADVGSLESLSDLREFSIGSEFVDSLARNQAMGSGKFSRATYERALSVVSGVSGKKMLEGGPRGKRQVKREDDAFAWRSHVTSRHEALRLMYWVVEGRIELANVGVKSELIIEQGKSRAISSLEFVEV